MGKKRRKGRFLWLLLLLAALALAALGLSYLPEARFLAGPPREVHRRLVDCRTRLFGGTREVVRKAMPETPQAAREPEPPPSMPMQAPVEQPKPASCAGDRYYAGMPQPARDYPYAIKVLDSPGFTVGYCAERKTAAWACFRAFRNGVRTAPPRPDRFTPDPRVANSPMSGDYTGSGYDRGHLAPNHIIAICYGKDAQEATFTMTNIIPQRPKLNRDLWRGIEAKEADDWRERYGTVWVITGPVYDANVETLRGGEEIPDACYRVVIRQDGGEPVVLALEVPQMVTGKERPDAFLTTVDRIEADTRLDFMRDLPDDEEDKVEAEKAAGMW